MERSAHSLLLLLLAAGLVVALLPAAAATFGPQPGAPCEAALLATQVQLFCTPDAPTTLCCDPVVAAFDLGGGVPCLCRVAAEPQLVMAGLNATHLLALYTSCGGIRPGGAHLAAACQGPAPPAAVVSSPPPPPPPSPAPRRKQAAHIAPAPAPLPSHHASAAELSLLWIGCFFSAGLYLWPIPIMFAICGGGALGQVKVDPFIFTVTNSATWILYAVSHNPFNGVLLIINAVGALLEVASSVGIVSGIVQLGFVLLVMYQIQKAQPGQVEALLALVQVQVQAAQAQAAQAEAEAQAQAEAEAQAQAHAEAQAQAQAQAAQAQAEAEAQAQAHAEDQAQAAQAQAEV
ncbi:hypothetical protein ZWY2020_037698 [Hordeum vulgare]|nr:hypothetical protein ZWY2020_037698 [Hordeum vulgare]